MKNKNEAGIYTYACIALTSHKHRSKKNIFGFSTLKMIYQQRTSNRFLDPSRNYLSNMHI